MMPLPVNPSLPGSPVPVRTASDLVLSLVPELKTRGARRLLHFGCGSGTSLAELDLRGFETHGTEIDPLLLRKELRKLPVFPYTARDLWLFPDGDYDFIFTICRLDNLSPEAIRTAISEFTRIARLGWCVFGVEACDLYPPAAKVSIASKGIVKVLYWKESPCISST